MKRKCFLKLISVLGVIFFSFSVRAASLSEQEARSWAEDKGQQLLTVFRNPDIQERYQALDGLFLEYVDMEYISRFVMGRYWRTMDTEQRDIFLRVFNRYALAMYKTMPLEFANNLSYQVADVTGDNEFTEISANVSFSLAPNKPQQSAKVRFRLHRTDRGIKLVDIKLEESSLILAYRTRFAEMIAKNDGEIEWFIEDIEDLAKSAERVVENKIRG